MEFSRWLAKQLEKRGWNASDLARASKMAGYKISRGQFSHILHGTRQAGPDACIAIAYALELSREEVFRARGWLLREPETVFKPNADPRLIELNRRINNWPSYLRNTMFEMIQCQASALELVREEAKVKV